MQEEGIEILKILNRVCANFSISPEDRERAISEFEKYMPLQDPKELRKMLIKIHDDLKDWETKGDGVKAIRKLYYEIARGIKGTPLSGKYAGGTRGFGWVILSRGLKKPEYKPMIAGTICQIQEDLEGYLGG